MLTRRDLLKRLSALSLLGLAGGGITLQSCQKASASGTRNVIKELGLRPFINAAGTYTSMSASLMPKGVMETINASSEEFVMLDEVQDKVGERIAEMCNAEAAMVSAGCWSAMVLGMAGVLTGLDPEKIAQLPDLESSDMKSEVIVLESHNVGYVHAITNTGVKIVTVETRQDIENVINDKTAMMWFLNKNAPAGNIQQEEWVKIGNKYGIPTMIDMAADVPPVENLWKYNDMGFDMVCVSGGKAIRGPQSAGILMGRKDLVAAARLNGPPRGNNIGRGMKVNKEEILGMYVALERYVNLDHDKEWKMWENRVDTIEKAVRTVNGVTTEVTIPPIANHTPALEISWDKNLLKASQSEIRERLLDGEPSVMVRGSGDNTLNLTVFMLKPGQEKIVADRIQEELSKALA